MGYTAKAPANYFIQHHSGISPLKLQKLVYVSHGWNLGVFGEPLVNDEYAEAWRYGPVFPSLYHEFKDFGSKPIDRWATDESDPNFAPTVPQIESIDTQTPELLERVWEGYGHFTPGQLSALTHAEGTPWYEAWHDSPGWRNLHIDNKVIRAHYEKLLEQLETDEEEAPR